MELTSTLEHSISRLKIGGGYVSHQRMWFRTNFQRKSSTFGLKRSSNQCIYIRSVIQVSITSKLSLASPNLLTVDFCKFVLLTTGTENSPLHSLNKMYYSSSFTGWMNLLQSAQSKNNPRNITAILNDTFWSTLKFYFSSHCHAKLFCFHTDYLKMERFPMNKFHICKV